MSQKQGEHKVETSGTNRAGNTWTKYDDGAYRYNNSGSSHQNHYFNDANGRDYMTDNGGKTSGYQWTRSDGADKNVKYDNRKKFSGLGGDELYFKLLGR
jgi:hypothetical protein